ncbi:class I SAM-dependent methyltransferase [Nocardioides caldifontis]|uniref:class I SAM-dependent methyltransferase n=1 Tax=Nocardioides caldifontis TaxID=2588938 RepID=UPI0011E018FA|nr:class I SAM-dependent methyltransferase [Nocardioides caldifontis]
MVEQPGYDALAEAYDEAFPSGYVSAVERHAVGAFADELLAAGLSGPVVDVGCGTGHVTADLASRGLDVVGVDPSEGMLAIARRRYPSLRWVQGDALPSTLSGSSFGGVLARFSLIHVPPDEVPVVLAAWVARLAPGGLVLVAFQCADDGEPPVVEFDHKVAPAWRWHPDAMASTLEAVGLQERWRLVTQRDAVRRFADCHLVASSS